MLIALVHCGPSRRNDNVFYWNVYHAVTTLDPAYIRTLGEVSVATQLYTTLLKLDDSLNVQPAAAYRYEIDSGGLRYRFFISPGIFFHPDECFGSPGATRECTAEDFAYSLKRLADPATASRSAWIMAGKLADQSNAIEAVGPKELVIRLKKPYVPFLSQLALVYCAAVPKEAVAKYGKGFGHRPVGTGPFKVFLWEQNERLVLHAHHQYYHKHLPYLDAVSISFVQARQNEFLLFLQGKLSVVTSLDPSFKDQVLNPDGSFKNSVTDAYRAEKWPYLNTEYLAFRLGSSPLIDDIRFRKAVNFAINREAILRYLRNNNGLLPHSGFIPNAIPGFYGENSYRHLFDLDSSRHYLRLAGYQGQPLVLHTIDAYKDIAVSVQNDLQKAGINANIELLTPAALLQSRLQGASLFFRASWAADYADAENYLSLFYSPNTVPNGPNYTFYNNPRFDRLYDRAVSTVDDEERYALYRKLHHTMMEDVPVVVLFHDQNVRLSHPNVEGLNRHPMNVMYLENVRLR